MCELKRRVNAALGGVSRNQKITVTFHSAKGTTDRQKIAAKHVSRRIRSKLRGFTTPDKLPLRITVQRKRHSAAHVVWKAPPAVQA